MLERLFKGLLLGLIAAAGAYSIGANLNTAGIVLALPVVFAIFDLMTRTVFSLALLFGVGALLWVYTPLGQVAAETLKKAAQTSLVRTPSN